MSLPLLHNAWAEQDEPGPSTISGRSPILVFEEPTETTALISRLRKRRRKQPTSYPWLHRKSGFYDQDDTETENNGLRVWYSDYTTIDWIHDITKDRLRVRRLRALRHTWFGWIRNGFDAIQGRFVFHRAWILVFIIGVSTGTIAAGIEKTSNLLFDFRSGYCSRDLSLDLDFCCKSFSLF